MSRSVCSLAIAAICAGAVLSSGQVHSSTAENTSAQTASPSAYVYVSNVSSTGKGQIEGFVASSNGALAPIARSPFPYYVNYMAVGGRSLFGVLSGNGVDSGQAIVSFSIGSNGALTFRAGEKVPDSYGGVTSIYVDRTGSSLYADYYITNNDYLSYSIAPSNGTLDYVGMLVEGPAQGSPLSFVGSNQFGYSSACYHYMPQIYGLVRESNGSLSSLGIAPDLPAEESGGFYCPYLAAADSTNHVAVAMQPMNMDWNPDGPWQIATYTADSAGNLTTASTYSNMPSVSVGNVVDYKTSPSGKMLAVAGTAGLQLFACNGENPITSLTGAVISSSIDQIFWDRANHIYAISRSTGQLYVFSVTAKGVTPSPGSPHAINGIENLIVVPR
jgi:hypothetical protein